jgi:hypothetical protein
MLDFCVCVNMVADGDGSMGKCEERHTLISFVRGSLNRCYVDTYLQHHIINGVVPRKWGGSDRLQAKRLFRSGWAGELAYLLLSSEYDTLS